MDDKDLLESFFILSFHLCLVEHALLFEEPGQIFSNGLVLFDLFALDALMTVQIIQQLHQVSSVDLHAHHVILHDLIVLLNAFVLLLHKIVCSVILLNVWATFTSYF